MFTGIIEQTGTVLAVRNAGGKRFIRVSNPFPQGELRLGDSVACQGICLTMTHLTATEFEVEVMNETALKTTATSWQAGSKLNLERAMPAHGRFDGHIVQGHIDLTSRIQAVRRIGETTYLEIALPPTAAGLVAPQGSIAVDGVSLTVADITSASFSVALIGFTLTHTTLQYRKTGELVNLEFDILGKYVQRQLTSSKISEEWLREKGF